VTTTRLFRLKIIAVAVVVVAAAACTILRLWAVGVASQWVRGAAEMPLSTRVMLAASNMSFRYGAPLILAASILSPFAGWLLRPSRSTDPAVLARRFVCWCAAVCVLVISSVLAYLSMLRWTAALSILDLLRVLVAIAWSLGCAEWFAFLAQPEPSARDIRFVWMAAVSTGALVVALEPIGGLLLGPTTLLAMRARHHRPSASAQSAPGRIRNP